ncbi:MAG: folate family ECF transporter S component [Gottschalkiaceae bacterium]|nr:MAG: folate family ECF transporter S component [Gottschalkiaceae bacterium]
MNNKKKIDTRSLVGASLLTAISIVLTRVFSFMIPLAGLPTLRFGIGEVPLIISGILFGPLVGGLSGVIADLIGVMINLQGSAFFPGFTLSSILWGVIPGVLFSLIRKNKFKINYNIINGVVLTSIAVGIVLVLFDSKVLAMKNGTYYMYDKPMPMIYAMLYVLLVASFIAIPIIMSRKENSKGEIFSIDKIAFIVTVPYIIISLGLNTLWLSMLYEKGFLILLPGRILAGLIVIPLHTTIIYTISKAFKHVKVS